MQINSPAVIAELTRLHTIYEKALIDNDVVTLEAMFWDSPHAIRYGVTENLHGSEEIRSFRQGRPKINLARTIDRLDIMAFGDSAGIVNLEFTRSIDGNERQGRQTQYWFRFLEGWKIVSAHVSLILVNPSYPEVAAAQLALPIPKDSRAAVNDDFTRLSSVARFLTEFPLPQGLEAAPVFEP